MRYSTIVEKDDKTLVDIITALEQFEEDRFIYDKGQSPGTSSFAKLFRL